MVVPRMSKPIALARAASASFDRSAIAMRPCRRIAASRSSTGTGRERSVASTAMTCAPASASAATSSMNGVMRTGEVSRSRLTSPTIGRSQALATAATLAAPSIRSARAPPSRAASASATIVATLSIGPPVTG